MKKLKLITLFLLCGLVLIHCRKDEITTEKDSTPTGVTNNVAFQIILASESGQAISNAEVLINSDVYTSDQNGIIETNKYDIPFAGLKCEVLAAGYVPIQKRFYGAENSTNVERIILVKTISKTIGTGETGEIDGEGLLELPTSLISEDGSAYEGPVRVSNKYLDPDELGFLSSAPGNLLAINTNNEYQQLASFGMYMIELRDLEGNDLTIPEGSFATITFPIADVHKDLAIDEIPLWYFDEEKGVWIEDGIATRSSEDSFEAKVSHFTWWNCDLPYDFVEVCFVFLDNEGEPTPGLEVEFKKDGATFGYAITDENGMILGKVPVGGNIDIIYYLNEEVSGSASVGPIDENNRKIFVDLDIEFNYISGQAIDCDGMPVSDGYGYYYIGDKINTVDISENGEFKYLSPKIAHSLILNDRATNKLATIEITENDQQTDLELSDIIVCDQSNLTMVSGYVLMDTDSDKIGDTPYEGARLIVRKFPLLGDSEVITDENGFYSSYISAGHRYVIFPLPENISVLAAGDESPEGNIQDEEYKIGQSSINTIGIIGEEETDNNFLIVPDGEGVITGSAFGDFDQNETYDSPLEWARIYLDRLNVPINSDYFGLDTTFVNSDGTFSFNSPAGLSYVSMYLSTFMSLSFYGDSTPDPDGGDSNLQRIEVFLQNNESDGDNNFLYMYSEKRSLLVRVMEDIDGDEVGDFPLASIPIQIGLRTGSGNVIKETDQFGIRRLFTDQSSSEKMEMTVTWISDTYEVIKIIDTSPDGDPLIIDGDMSKMEIDLEVGEWDAGNIFVVRKK